MDRDTLTREAIVYKVNANIRLIRWCQNSPGVVNGRLASEISQEAKAKNEVYQAILAEHERGG